MMGDIKFLLGFAAGWIATTSEGKQFANKLADGTISLAKNYLERKNTEKSAEKTNDQA